MDAPEQSRVDACTQGRWGIDGRCFLGGRRGRTERGTEGRQAFGAPCGYYGRREGDTA